MTSRLAFTTLISLSSLVVACSNVWDDSSAAGVDSTCSRERGTYVWTYRAIRGEGCKDTDYPSAELPAESPAPHESSLWWLGVAPGDCVGRSERATCDFATTCTIIEKNYTMTFSTEENSLGGVVRGTFSASAISDDPRLNLDCTYAFEARRK